MNQPAMIGLGLIAGLILVAELLVQPLYYSLRSDAEAQLLSKAGDARALLEAELSEGIYITIGLESFIQSQQGNPEIDDIKRWLGLLFEHTRTLRNIGIAPDNRITAVFPIADNEAVIGLDYRELPEQWPAVERMMDTGEDSLVGPISLVQGGEGLIYRRPVFVDGQYWGLISTVIELPAVLAEVERYSQDQNVRLQLSRLDPAGQVVFAGQKAQMPRLEQSMTLDLPGQVQWRLTMSDTHSNWPVWLARLVLWSFGFLLALFTWQRLRARQQAQALRDKTTREKLDFIHTISHELRTPLTSISGALALLQQPQADQAAKQRLQELAIRNTQRLQRLVDEVLDIARMDASRMQLELAEQPIAELVNQAVENNTPFAQQRGITLKIAIHDHVHSAKARVDSQRFLQIMDNLISNAIKFSDSGQSVEVAAQVKDKALDISVRDQGTGIPEHFMDQLFERFARLDQSDRRRNQDGTGLGLHIARELARAMDGDITVESKPGLGSCFTLTLPISGNP